jgi:hypothetical protein
MRPVFFRHIRFTFFGELPSSRLARLSRCSAEIAETYRDHTESQVNGFNVLLSRSGDLVNGREFSMSENIKQEREQVAALLRKFVVDDEFRHAFEADPRAAIAGSGLPLSAEATDQIVASASSVPSVLAHMEGTEEISKFFFYAKVVDD